VEIGDTDYAINLFGEINAALVEKRNVEYK
jgi:hypothetical protein